ncbi:hypothetical protein Vadar_018667 [Vaccinium darrowii]|uniref:Uncharacterized protein n=1 Tax=Vaccinium darrowii TaxID=229202 RepID=A0ACB7Z4T6_9ERIC|nr:hypothetical protein Vadar_018667 [Vaccinium darrowii]
MNPVMYKSAMEGDLDLLMKHIKVLGEGRKNNTILHHELTPNHNTILHVAVQFGHAHIVKAVLQELPQLVLQRNNKRETPLHMAAREGHADIVNQLILGAKKLEDGKVKEMLRNKSVDVKLLVEEDPEFQHPPNNDKETPLYLAAERGNKGVKVVFALLDTCKSISYSGPGGRTALHAVALKDFTIGQKTIQALLKRQKDLMNQADVNGWTPIHYAACSGNLLWMEEFLSYCPDCWEKVDEKGQNILHIAVCRGGNTPLHLLVASDYNVDELWKHHKADHHVFNRKGMTPIDLLWTNILEKKMSTFADTMDYTFLDPENEGGRIIASKAHDKLAILKRLREENRRKEKAMEEAQEKDKRAREEAEEKEKREREEAHEKEERATLEEQKEKKRKQIKARKASMTVYQSLVIVAALIATISSAAAFVIPGGYDGNQGRDQGMAVLARIAAFKAFTITNTIALASSVTSILLCLSALYYYSIGKGESQITLRYAVAGFAILIAIFSLMLAFITVAFAVLAHSIALAMSTCIIVCIGFIVFFVEVEKFLYQLRRAKLESEAANSGNGAINMV